MARTAVSSPCTMYTPFFPVPDIPEIFRLRNPGGGMRKDWVVV